MDFRVRFGQRPLSQATNAPTSTLSILLIASGAICVSCLPGHAHDQLKLGGVL